MQALSTINNMDREFVIRRMYLYDMMMICLFIPSFLYLHYDHTTLSIMECHEPLLCNYRTDPRGGALALLCN